MQYLLRKFQKQSFATGSHFHKKAGFCENPNKTAIFRALRRRSRKIERSQELKWLILFIILHI
jgi:hypothetical protein